MDRLLIFSDDTSPGTDLQKVLAGEYHVDVIDGKRGDPSGWIKRYRPATIIVNLKGSSGLEVCSFLAAQEDAEYLPILFIHDKEESGIRALELGASDYVSATAGMRLMALKIGKLVMWRRKTEQLSKSASKTRHEVEELQNVMQMVGHDLKSPASAIAGFARLVGRIWSGLPSDPRIGQILKHMATASNTVLDLLGELTGKVPGEADARECAATQLGETVEEVVHRHGPALDARKIKVILDMPEPPGVVLGERCGVTQVLDNIFINAIEHMGRVPNACIRVNLTEEGDFIVTSVADNGVGIPSDYRDKVFERYFRIPGRESQAGSGLGLHIARSIIEGYNGRMWVESSPGTGATFHFSLPKSSGAAWDSEESAATSSR
ncbi:ATP-binding protein [Thermodesulfobacteriota bacterium]